MTLIAPRQLPDHLLSQGVSTFTMRDAQEMLDESSPAAVRRALSRLRASGQVFSPAQGFWVVIPPEYRSWGVVPAELFIDEMMRALGPRGRGLVRRVGWLVERFGHYDDLGPLREAAAPDEGEPTLLRAGAGRRGHTDRSWGIRVNTDVQADL
jgi:predicted transcriptional regulator of viral defense system